MSPHQSFNPDLPVYRNSDVLGGVFRNGSVADKTTLKALRLHLADGQQPVAQYWTGYQYSQLFKVADAQPMPPLSPARQARWDAARTCARCGERRRDPFDLHENTGRRMCYTCLPVEREVHWYQVRNVDRAHVMRLAQELLADPNLVLWTCTDASPEGGHRWLTAAAGIDTSGAVVFAGEVRVNQHQPAPSWWTIPDGFEGRGVPLADYAEQFGQLAGRRILSWQAWQGPLELAVHNELGIDLPAVKRDRLVAADGPPLRTSGLDLAGLWLGRRRTNDSCWPHSYAPVRDIEAVPVVSWGPADSDLDLPGKAVECAAKSRHLLTLLRFIAKDCHPDGPPVCPHRDGRDGSPCGLPACNDGMCISHEPLGGQA